MFRKIVFILIASLVIGSCLPINRPSPKQSAFHLARPFVAPLPTAPVEAADDSPPSVLPNFAQPVIAPLPSSDTYGQTYVSAPTTEPPNHQTIRLPIIEYHYSTFRMGDGVWMETEWFESQLQWLDDNDFTTLTAEQLVAFIHGEYTPPQRSVVLTFDVGASKFDDYANVVIPALRRYNLHAIFFVLASRTVDSCDDPDLTCWPMIKQWADEGIISVDSHTWSHIDYATLTPEEIFRDAGRSKALIEEKTGHTVLGICYPFDSVNPAAFDLLKTLGYQFAVGGFTRAERSVTVNDPEPYNLPRYYPYSGDYYPIIGGTHGLTFEEMVTAAIDQ